MLSFTDKIGMLARVASRAKSPPSAHAMPPARPSVVYSFYMPIGGGRAHSGQMFSTRKNDPRLDFFVCDTIVKDWKLAKKARVMEKGVRGGVDFMLVDCDGICNNVFFRIGN